MRVPLEEQFGRSLIDPVRGDELRIMISNAIKRGEHVELDFAGVDLMLSAFLNPALGDLYREFSSAELSSRLEILNDSDALRTIISYVIENAKEHALGDRYTKANDEAVKKMLEE